MERKSEKNGENSEKIRENQRKTEKFRENQRNLEKIREFKRKSEKIGELSVNFRYICKDYLKISVHIRRNYLKIFAHIRKKCKLYFASSRHPRKAFLPFYLFTFLLFYLFTFLPFNVPCFTQPFCTFAYEKTRSMIPRDFRTEFRLAEGTPIPKQSRNIPETIPKDR